MGEDMRSWPIWPLSLAQAGPHTGLHVSASGPTKLRPFDPCHVMNSIVPEKLWLRRVRNPFSQKKSIASKTFRGRSLFTSLIKLSRLR